MSHKKQYSELQRALNEVKADIRIVRAVIKQFKNVSHFFEMLGVEAGFAIPGAGQIFFLMSVLIMPYIQMIVDGVVREQMRQQQIEQTLENRREREQMLREVREEIERERRTDYRSVIPG